MRELNGVLNALVSAPPPGVEYINGWATGQGGTGYITNVFDDTVPSSRQLIDGLAFSITGALYVTTDTPSGSNLVNGLRVRADGAVYVSETGPQVQISSYGWPLNARGQALITGDIPVFANMAAWYRQNLGVTQADRLVSAWADQSGNARNLLQATLGNRPQFITWDGTNYLNLTGATDSSASTPSTLSAEMITNAVNRNFSGAGNWSLGVGVAVGSGTMNWTAVLNNVTSSLTAAFTNPDIIIGQAYAVTYTVSGFTAGGIRPLIGSGGTGTTRAANGVFQDIVVASGDTTLYFQAVGASTTLSIDNVSLKKVGALDYFPTGISFLMKISPDDWTPGATDALISKDDGAGVDREYGINLLVNGTLRLDTFANPTTVLSGTSTAAVSLADGTPIWVLAILTVNDGGGNRVYRFYTSPDRVTWTQLGSTVTTAGVAFISAGTAPLRIGAGVSGTNNNYSGGFYTAELWNAPLSVVDGALVTSGATQVFNANFTLQSETTRSFVESSVNAATVTLNGGCGIIGSESNNTVYFDGVADYLKTVSFNLDQATTIFILFKQITWTANDAIFDGDASNSGKLFQLTGTPNVAINAGSSVSSNPDPVLCTYNVMVLTFNGASSSIRLNNNAAVSGDAGATNMDGITLGALGGATNFGNCQIVECMAYPQTLTAAQIQQNVNYLANLGNLSI